MDKFIKALNNDHNDHNDDGTPPILLLFSYYIPCDQSHIQNPTRCARDLGKWVKGIKRKGRSIQIFVSFVRVFKTWDTLGVTNDFTNLDKAVKYLMSPDICLTYLVPKGIPDDVYPIPKVSLANLNDLSVSPCLEHAGVPTSHYQNLFDFNPIARPDKIAQVMLYQHLVRFVSKCMDDHKRGNEILAFAINFAFKGCIQDDKEGYNCGREGRPLMGNIGISGTRQKLYKCLSDYWVNKLGQFRSNRCNGNPTHIVNTGVRTALQGGVTVGFPANYTHLPYWKSLLGPWNIAVKAHFDTGPNNPAVRCPNGQSPEYLCTRPYTSQSSSSRSRSRTRSISSSSSWSRPRYRSRSPIN